MSSSPESQIVQHGPPYAPATAAVGGRPTVHEDVPILAVFLALYLIGAISNMTIFQKNRRRGHKFPASWGMFAFCMARVLSCTLRIVWATQIQNARLAIAAAIFLNLGIMVIYAVVLVFASRILRATQPTLGWNATLRKTIKAVYIGIVVVVIIVLSFTVASVETLDHKIRITALWVQRAANLYLLILNCISAVFFLLSCILPKDPKSENFGSGSMVEKKTLLGVAIFFTLFISGFRCGTIWAAPRPASDPAWYDHRALFYLVLLGFEIVIIYLFIFTRFDRKFWVPNGSQGPGDYSRQEEVISEDNKASLDSKVHDPEVHDSEVHDSDTQSV